jgi:hypothetical protein
MCYSLLDRETLPVECSIHSAVSKKSMPEREEMLRTTGRIDEVMKEAASIALTYAKNFLFVLDPSNRFFEDVRWRLSLQSLNFNGLIFIFDYYNLKVVDSHAHAPRQPRKGRNLCRSRHGHRTPVSGNEKTY